MSEFKLVGARHFHDDGVTYKKNDIIEDDRDLVATFPGKFQLLGEGRRRGAKKETIPHEKDSPGTDDVGGRVLDVPETQRNLDEDDDSEDPAPRKASKMPAGSKANDKSLKKSKKSADFDD